jgi:hypothetical protein
MMALDRAGLVDAWLSSRRWAHARPELRDFHARRYRALSGAFEVDLDRFPEGADRTLALLFEDTLRVIESTRTPFAGLLEADERIAALHRAHGRAMSAAADELVARCRALLEELVGAIWDVAGDRSVWPKDVFARGFNPSERAPEGCGRM